MNNQIKSTMTKLIFVAPRLGWTKPLVIVCTCLLLHLTGVAHAAIDDPLDNWAPADITRLDAQITDGFLTININLRDPLYNLTFYSGRQVIQIFLDSDQSSDTGDYRDGAVAGTDFVIECSGGALTSCTLHALPLDRHQKGNTSIFSQIPGASVALPNNRTLTLRLPTDAIHGSSTLDIFAVAYLTGNNPILSHKILYGNGDRCPDAGALDTATGNVVVRHAGAPVNATMTALLDGSGSEYQLVQAQFRTVGDQFEITLFYNQLIDLSSFEALRGGIVLDSDRSLNTGQLCMIRPHGLGDEIPSWGGDVSLSFWLDDVGTITSFKLSYGTLFSPVPFGYGTGSYSIPLLGCSTGSFINFERFPFNDGSWHVQDNMLILRGSLSLFDASELIADLSDSTCNSDEIIRHATDGRMITRIYTVDESTGEKSVTPEMGRAFDSGTGQTLEPLRWDPASMISKKDPAEYGLVWGYDLVRIDAQIIEGNLVVKGVLTLWTETDAYSYFEILLDTDMNKLTGEFVANKFEPGEPAIGADYKLVVYAFSFGIGTYYLTDLVRPDGKVELHDAYLFAEPGTFNAPNKEDSFTVTIPLNRLGNPNELAMFTATRRWYHLPSERYDIAPTEPIRLGGINYCKSDFDQDEDVDGSDLAIFATDFGRTDCDQGQECKGNFDQDGDVDDSDLAVFAADFGRTDCP